MKKIIVVVILATTLFAACNKSEFSDPMDVTSKMSGKIAGPKNKITVDFTAIADQKAIVTITGTKGEGTFVFDSDNGIKQTQTIPRKAMYTVIWEYYAVTPVSCNYMLYWNYTGISIFGTYPYSYISTCCVSFEKNAVLTFYKDCQS